jgi:hypothetical protein
MKINKLKEIIKEAISELSTKSSGVPEFLSHAEKQQYPFLQFPSFEDLKDYVLDASIEEFQELKDEVGMNEAFFMGEDEIDEYDVDENNPEEIKDFITFMNEYNSFLAEAGCPCVYEAEYRGRKVQLGKPMQGDIKKFKVYVKNNKGKVVKVNFGFGGKSAKGKRMHIKVKNPKRRAAYRKRHNCKNPGPRWKANYWSCRAW